MSKLTLKQAIETIKKSGYSDALIDRCGLWSRVTDEVRQRYQNRYIRAIVWDYDRDEGIAYIETE